MRYLLCELFRDTIEVAKETGVWQGLTEAEKNELVEEILREYGSIMDEADMKCVSRLGYAR